MNAPISVWLEDKKILQKSYEEYLSNNIIKRSLLSHNLVKAYIEKSDHNIEFSYFLAKNKKFLDWAIIGLYYAVYHASLSLLASKGYSSKDHSATVCFIIKNYSAFSYEDIQLYKELMMTREEIDFYIQLKDERRKANYSTSIIYDAATIERLRQKTIMFINKVKSLLKKQEIM